MPTVVVGGRGEGGGRRETHWPSLVKTWLAFV